MNYIYFFVYTVFSILCFLPGLKIFRRARSLPKNSQQFDRLQSLLLGYWYLSFAHITFAFTVFFHSHPAALGWLFLSIQIWFIAAFLHFLMIPLSFRLPEFRERILRLFITTAAVIMIWSVMRFRFPYFDKSMELIDWNIDPFFSLFIFLLFLAIIIPTVSFYFQQALKSSAGVVRIRSFFMSMGFSFLLFSFLIFYLFSVVFECFSIPASTGIGLILLFFGIYHASFSSKKPPSTRPNDSSTPPS